MPAKQKPEDLIWSETRYDCRITKVKERKKVEVSLSVSVIEAMATDISASFRSSLSNTKEDGTQRDAIAVQEKQGQQL